MRLRNALTHARLVVGDRMRGLCQRLAARAEQRGRVFRIGGYLHRYYLHENRWFSIKLHHFLRSDADLELHNHPWKRALSVILVGGYVEERRVKDPLNDRFWRVMPRRFLPGSINTISGDTFHRVDLIGDDCWTLFVTSRETTPEPWGFWNRDSYRFWPHKTFFALNEQRNYLS